MKRRTFLQASGAMLAAITLSARAQRAPSVSVYKSPACGCCGGWIEHMRANGFRVEVHELADVTPVKTQYRIPDSLWSCHTAVADGYALEGHVPAADVKRLLRERPRVRGLAVPGMVPGSPGMEGSPQAYATIAFDERGTRVFERH